MFGKPRSVIISATEDAWAETVIPRLMACGADLEKILRIDAVTPEGLPEAVKLPRDLAEPERIVKAEDVALLLLDPLIGSVSGSIDSHKDHEVRHALEPLARLASEAKISIIGLIHVNKSQAADLLNRVMASKAFAAVARGVLYALVRSRRSPAARSDR
jgi:RecA-family ATPase